MIPPLKQRILLLASVFLPLGATACAQDAASESPSITEIGKTKFEQICIACHKYERTDAMIAPPAFAIQMHYSQSFGTDETAFRKAIVDWAKAPNQAKTLMPGAIQKFNLMPPLPLPDEDLDAIAAYLYSSEFTQACDPTQMQKNMK